MLAGLTGKHIARAGRLGSGPALGPNAKRRTDIASPSDTAIARIFAALGDPTRLKLVTLLCAGGAFSIAQLTATTDISRQGVTKHLQVLADAGVVRDVKQGRERLWQLDPEQITAARAALEQIGRQWEEALGRLKAFVESSP